MEVLEVMHGTHKSFYGKAKVETAGAQKILYSYDTKILTFDNNHGEIVAIHWKDYSETTMRHVNEFLQQNNHPKLTKRDWLSLHTLV